MQDNRIPHRQSQVIDHDERTLGELFSQLSGEISTLVRQEAELAKTEMSQKLTSTAKDAAMIAVGGALAYAGLLFLMATLVIILANFVPAWVAALVVGVVAVAIAYFLVQRGLSEIKQRSLAPEQTIESIKEGKQWLETQIT